MHTHNMELINFGYMNDFLQIDYIAGPAMNADDISGVDMTAVIAAADAAELVVICIGEDTYTEKPGDINDLTLPNGQIEVRLVDV